MYQSQESFQIKIIESTGEKVVLKCLGELDIGAMENFEEDLDALASTKPKQVVFDLSEAKFICGAGYVAIGRCCYAVESASVYSKDRFAEKILRILGFDHIVFVVQRSTRIQHRPGPLMIV